MDKINFVNKGQPAINDTNLNKMQSNIEKASEGIILYENTSGKKNNITLSGDSFANYKRFKIYGYYSYLDGNTSSNVKTQISQEAVYDTSKKIPLIGYVVGTGTLLQLNEEISISGNKLEIYRRGYTVLANASNIGYTLNPTDQYIYITKIVGFKD